MILAIWGELWSPIFLITIGGIYRGGRRNGMMPRVLLINSFAASADVAAAASRACPVSKSKLAITPESMDITMSERKKSGPKRTKESMMRRMGVY